MLMAIPWAKLPMWVLWQKQDLLQVSAKEMEAHSTESLTTADEDALSFDKSAN